MLSIIMSQHDIVIIIHAYLNNWPERTESLYIFAGRKSNLYFIDANHTVVFLLSGSKDDEGQGTERFSSGQRWIRKTKSPLGQIVNYYKIHVEYGRRHQWYFCPTSTVTHVRYYGRTIFRYKKLASYTFGFNQCL